MREPSQSRYGPYPSIAGASTRPEQVCTPQWVYLHKCWPPACGWVFWDAPEKNSKNRQLLQHLHQFQIEDCQQKYDLCWPWPTIWYYRQCTTGKGRRSTSFEKVNSFWERPIHKLSVYIGPNFNMVYQEGVVFMGERNFIKKLKF